jgi:hypothetical protein
MPINNKEQREQQQALTRALLMSPQGVCMPELKPLARRMSREEQRAYRLSILQLALDITSGDDDSFFESSVLVSSRTSSRYDKDEDEDMDDRRQSQ